MRRTLILIGSLIALAFGITQMAQAQRNCTTTCTSDGNGGQICHTHCGGYA